MKGLRLLLILLAFLVGAEELPQQKTAQEKNSTFPPFKPTLNLWEGAIRSFEQEDEKSPPPKQPILFVGSSSIRLWNLKKFFPNLPVLNRGFGGSFMSDVNAFFDRLVAKYTPKIIVLYSGDNDIALGKSVESVVADYRSFLEHVKTTLPNTHVIVLSIKPSPLRWNFYPSMKQVNENIRKLCEQDPKFTFLDTAPTLLDAEGHVRPELFRPDGLHLNDEGYRAWSDLVRPHLHRIFEIKDP
jgi:lysophospholipase L1-like esterase